MNDVKSENSLIQQKFYKIHGLCNKSVKELDTLFEESKNYKNFYSQLIYGEYPVEDIDLKHLYKLYSEIKELMYMIDLNSEIYGLMTENNIIKSQITELKGSD